MSRVVALGHVTFGGRLEKDARGFPASAMARKLSGDWRNPSKIGAWADELAAALPAARPGHAVEPVWATGGLASTLPWPKPDAARRAA